MDHASSPLYPSQNGDLIIQTSNEVLFGVHSLLLKLSSTVMNDMLTVGSGSEHRNMVNITEDSGIFQDLLSFIYPDKTPTIFTTLTGLIPVLDAAAKYDMKGVIGSLSVQLTKGMAGDALMYQNPVWVYIKAKQLDLADLAGTAANATLTIDLSEAPRHPEVDNAPASWVLELVKLRAQHSRWWSPQCNQPISISRMTRDYEPTRGAAFYRRIACQCPHNNSSGDTIKPPTEVALKIMQRPCAKSVREIDFHQVLGCLGCGAAATAHYRKICLDYEKEYGKS